MIATDSCDRHGDAINRLREAGVSAGAIGVGEALEIEGDHIRKSRNGSE